MGMFMNKMGIDFDFDGVIMGMHIVGVISWVKRHGYDWTLTRIIARQTIQTIGF